MSQKSTLEKFNILRSMIHDPQDCIALSASNQGESVQITWQELAEYIERLSDDLSGAMSTLAFVRRQLLGLTTQDYSDQELVQIIADFERDYSREKGIDE